MCITNPELREHLAEGSYITLDRFAHDGNFRELVFPDRVLQTFRYAKEKAGDFHICGESCDGYPNLDYDYDGTFGADEFINNIGRLLRVNYPKTRFAKDRTVDDRIRAGWECFGERGR